MTLFRCPSGRPLSNSLIQMLHQEIGCSQTSKGWCVGALRTFHLVLPKSRFESWKARPGVTHWSTHRATCSCEESHLCLQHGQLPRQVLVASSVSLTNPLNLINWQTCLWPTSTKYAGFPHTYTVSLPWVVYKILWRVVNQYVILDLFYSTYMSILPACT